MLEEYSFECPYCWQEISMLLDLSAGGQSYIEDCEICCNPIEVKYKVEAGALAAFEANPLEQ